MCGVGHRGRRRPDRARPVHGAARVAAAPRGPAHHRGHLRLHRRGRADALRGGALRAQGLPAAAARWEGRVVLVDAGGALRALRARPAAGAGHGLHRGGREGRRRAVGAGAACDDQHRRRGEVATGVRGRAGRCGLQACRRAARQRPARGHARAHRCRRLRGRRADGQTGAAARSAAEGRRQRLPRRPQQGPACRGRERRAALRPAPPGRRAAACGAGEPGRPDDDPRRAPRVRGAGPDPGGQCLPVLRAAEDRQKHGGAVPGAGRGARRIVARLAHDAGRGLDVCV
jgi:hypothetical protein